MVVLAGVVGDGGFFAPVDPFGVVDCGKWGGGDVGRGASGGWEAEGWVAAPGNLFALQRALCGGQSGEMAARLKAGRLFTWSRGA